MYANALLKRIDDFNNLFSDINKKSYKREYIIYYSMNLCIFSEEQLGETINFKQLLLLLNKNIINDDFFVSFSLYVQSFIASNI